MTSNNSDQNKPCERCKGRGVVLDRPLQKGGGYPCPACSKSKIGTDSPVFTKAFQERLKPEWLENHFCRFNDGEHSCECFVDGYKAGVKAARADQTMFHSCLCGKMPTPEEQAKALAELDSVKFLMKAEHERGKKEGAMIAFNLIDDSAPKFEEEAKKTDDGETWLLARSLRRVRKWLNLELPKHLTKPSSD